MTEPTIEELRRWSAEDLMGWFPRYAEDNRCYDYYYMPYESRDNRYGMQITSWLPDCPESGQIWMVVEKMRELREDGSDGFNFNFNWQGHKGITIALAQFHRICGKMEFGSGADDNPCLAILKAAHAAKEER